MGAASTGRWAGGEARVAEFYPGRPQHGIVPGWREPDRYRSRSEPDFDVVEDAERVRNQDGGRVIRTDQIRDDGLLVDTHEPH